LLPEVIILGGDIYKWLDLGTEATLVSKEDGEIVD
jgi:hypothetical protein